MRTETPPTIRLSDYRPPAYLVDSVHLTFQLSPNATRVTSQLQMRPNPETPAGQDLFLDGEELMLDTAAIDDTPLDRARLGLTDAGLTIPADLLPDGPFTFTAQTVINPTGNTALSGLYVSKGMYCTQCEAEGFRRITYFPDRPDVMATYTVRIESDQPVMLSNGNPTDAGPGWAEWHDPWPKPSYLFALVAGDLVSVEDSFVTASDRDVTLRIFTRPGDEGKVDYAMDALKRSMRWDEQVYGREYDLDLFMIVVVDDFNMGAMENKGLNIFNSKYTLASPETATDSDYAFIERIVAHEYFHNWTGNRITCRDWFQLCLKEGLTVFRDQEFSGDQRGHALKRIGDVKNLRGRQFREDAGPLAHPVRPDAYVEINNFYTATVYEKGAEVIRILQHLVGEDGYRTALDLYFDRHDGDAATIEDWLKVFEDATGRDLTQFKRWYTQAGTPTVTVDEDWEGSTFTLTLSQTTPATPGQPDKNPFVIPVAVGLLTPSGHETAPTRILELDSARASFTWEGLSDRPIPSILRGFSAPVHLNQTTKSDHRTLLLAHDTDPFNRWEAAHTLALDLLVSAATGQTADAEAFLDGMAAVARDSALDPAFRALTLALPGEDGIAAEISRRGTPVDPAAVHTARASLDTALARHLDDDLRPLYVSMVVPGPYTPDTEASGKRALRNRALGLLTRLEPDAATAREQFARADNMTEQFAALSVCVVAGQAESTLGAFYDRWKDDRLVIDKWFAVQAAASPPQTALATVGALSAHPAFDWQNPNRFRSLFGTFAIGNPAGFHRADGAGYALLTDWLLKLDPINPQTTARLAGAFETWRRYDEDRQTLLLRQLQRLVDAPGLSKDTSEIVGRILDA